ncbi:hypothetical protein SteCoe_31698 [Stentor coeruleus]|uniref:Uncharacterized protein n=1 Tax=Stentor coeruleus TaxID=5963 RepID=A0A1R2B0N7_9CILI|nr:hypothetical protein SteCoe_31698 [Stentor coeruleus]
MFIIKNSKIINSKTPESPSPKKLKITFSEESLNTQSHLFKTRKSPLESSSSSKNIQTTITQKERRAHRALKAKIHNILSSLPENCQTLDRKHVKSLANLKKQKLKQLNDIRKKMKKQPLSPRDFSLDCIYDKYGNISKKPKIFESPLTPRTAIKEKLAKIEFDMFKEDPVFFIKKKEYKYKIKINDESWEDLLDNNSKSKLSNASNSKLQISDEPVKTFHSSHSVEDNKKNKKAERFCGRLKITDRNEREYMKGIKEILKNKKNLNGEEKFQSFPEEMIRKKLEKFFRLRKLKENSKSFMSDYNRKLDKVHGNLRKQKEIEDKIMKFEERTRAVEDFYVHRMKKAALEEKIKKAKDCLNSVSRKLNTDSNEDSFKKYAIKVCCKDLL